MDARYLVAAASLLVAAASLIVAALAAQRLIALTRELENLREALSELEEVKQQLLERVRELEEVRKEGNLWSPIISSEVRAIAYILPSGSCVPLWREKYGDRIYFYAYANLSEFRKFIESDFRAISLVYNTVIIVIPADDTELYFSNLKLIDAIAIEAGLKVMWARVHYSGHSDE